MNIPRLNLPRVVIVGGRFAGLIVAKRLKKSRLQVIMIDKNNYHTFQPLLYQVATSGLEPDSITYPIRKIFNEYENFHFRIASVQRIIPDKNTLVTNKGEINYDYLVLTTGAQTNYFGLDDVKKLSMPMKTIREALNLRSLILQNLEDALMVNDLKDREKLMNYVIVGGGPTGVELAGALAELKKSVLPKDYPDLDLRNMNIHLIESGPRLLGTMSAESSSFAMKFLKDMEVNVWVNTRVTGYDGDEVKTNSPKDFPAKTLIWTAGVKGAPVKGIPIINPAGRFIVDKFNRVSGHNNIFAAGDVASMISKEYPKGHPMLATVAIKQGEILGRNIDSLIKDKPLKSFNYNNWGTMATIGRNKAVVDLTKFRFQGTFAWFVWTLVHLMLLVGFRNKVVTLINWVWSYFNYDKGVRLIIRPFKRKKLRILEDQKNPSLVVSQSL
ncbi:MAG: NAD(P)/FAD-dependent oxidoreductase [Bacteroidetes bacterium]|nr:NAD(P)/FAD-dependent oxidoreductase [Bacteroidota bacterium]